MPRIPLFRNIVAIAALACMTGPASAVLYTGSYTVTAHSNPSNGLAIGVQNDFGSTPAVEVVNGDNTSYTSTFSFNLVKGALNPIDLFELFAFESPPYLADDLVPQPISVMFNFNGPSTLSGLITGTTRGLANAPDANGNTALLHWNGGVNINFPTGKLAINLGPDQLFGDSFNTVVSFVAVPEPDTLALFCIGLVGALALRQRKSARG